MAASQNSIVGMILAGVCGLCGFIILCMANVKSALGAMILVGFLGTGVYGAARLAYLLHTGGTITLGFIDQNKKLVNLAIACISGFCGLMFFVPFILACIAVGGGGYGWASGIVYAIIALDLICTVTSVGSTVLAILELKSVE